MLKHTRSFDAINEPHLNFYFKLRILFICFLFYLFEYIYLFLLYKLLFPAQASKRGHWHSPLVHTFYFETNLLLLSVCDIKEMKNSLLKGKRFMSFNLYIQIRNLLFWENLVGKFFLYIHLLVFCFFFYFLIMITLI